ncbi:hypothetical protein JEY40_12255 [Bradyrhizobium japonicum]|uniref:hypothetical protein n=1 Tax=Bradyrhizobium japonicum TaxID=375 RepID=UPI00200F4660|nr:hypothetical protein [Bradyrhizobium japonicum]UQD75225.1 hypothetical protein JEY40_12255 [Bradyrhizobium japonicum]
MTSSNSLRTFVLAGAGALLSGTIAQAGPIPTHLSTMKSMVDQTTTEVRWVGGWRGGYGYRGVGWGYRGGLGYRGYGYRGYGYRGLGYGVVAGAVVGGAIARSAYYGGSYGGYYGGYPGYGYGYPAASYYGYGGGDYGYGYFGDNCAPSGSYWAY